ncbi:MAG: class I SAM-dependent methyltransferase [Candidatus Buchananbacteria bacterium]
MLKDKKWQDKWINKNNWPESRFAKRVYLFIKNKKLETVLDLGCGGGRDSKYFSQKGYKVVALDIMVSQSQQEKLKHDHIKFIKSDIRNIKIKNDSFDIIYAHLSLHYFDDRTTDKIFSKLYKILKPGGYIFIKCKSINDPLFGKGKKIEENIYKSDYLRHFFSKNYMNEKLKNFKIIKIFKTNVFKHPGKASFIEAFARK